MTWREIEKIPDRRVAVTYAPLGKGGANRVIVTLPPELCREIGIARGAACRIYAGTAQDAGACRIEPEDHGPNSHIFMAAGRGACRVAFRPREIVAAEPRPREDRPARVEDGNAVIVDMPEWWRTAFARSAKPSNA